MAKEKLSLGKRRFPQTVSYLIRCSCFMFAISFLVWKRRACVLLTIASWTWKINLHQLDCTISWQQIYPLVQLKCVGTKPNVMLVVSHMLVSFVQKPVDVDSCKLKSRVRLWWAVFFVQPGRKWVHNNHFLFIFKEDETDKLQTNFHYNLLLSKEIGRESPS
jgi:hypothetical protein